jgi:Tfp pilus assembly protein PilN
MKLDLRIDFIGRRKLPPLGLALALAAAGLAAWQGSLVAQDAEQLQRQRASLAALERPRKPARPTMSAEDVRRHHQIEAVARHLATPWEPLLSLFEARAPQGVVLTKFRPDAGLGRIELTARAATPEAVGAYLMQLERDSRLRNVLLQHHEVLQDQPGAPVEFAIGADWIGPTAAAGSPAAAAAEAEPAGATAAQLMDEKEAMEGAEASQASKALANGATGAAGSTAATPVSPASPKSPTAKASPVASMTSLNPAIPPTPTTPVASVNAVKTVNAVTSANTVSPVSQVPR